MQGGPGNPRVPVQLPWGPPLHPQVGGTPEGKAWWMSQGSLRHTPGPDRLTVHSPHPPGRAAASHLVPVVGEQRKFRSHQEQLPKEPDVTGAPQNAGLLSPLSTSEHTSAVPGLSLLGVSAGSHPEHSTGRSGGQAVWGEEGIPT